MMGRNNHLLVWVKRRLDETHHSDNFAVTNIKNGDNVRDNPEKVFKEGKLTLIRGFSLSLIELPTFLTSPVELGCQHRAPSSPTTPPAPPAGLTLAQAISGYQLQTKPGRKRSQWTIMVVGLSFFAMCLILIGTTLHYATKYQDQAMARMINISSSFSMMDMLDQNSSVMISDVIL